MRRRNETWKRGWSCDFYGFEAAVPSSTLLRYYCGWGAPVQPTEHAILCRTRFMMDRVKLRLGRVGAARPYMLDAVAVADVDADGPVRNETAVALRTRSWEGDTRIEAKFFEANRLAQAVDAYRPRGDAAARVPTFVIGGGVNVLRRWSSSLQFGGELLVMAREQMPPTATPYTIAPPDVANSVYGAGAPRVLVWRAHADPRTRHRRAFRPSH